ncbi:MAG: hypothetical protein HY840_08830 [Bacteroidetes bacterium]|nr:hypothetical protein [Bacteroidota bacterium]
MNTQNTQPKKQRSPFAYGKIVFIEYSTAEKGQHFMAVMQTEDGKRQVIARFFREWDAENKKMKYTAKDREGKEIFPADFNLYALKKKFIEKAKEKLQQFTQSLAHEKIAESTEPEKDKALEQMKRETELNEMRDEKEKGKDKGKQLTR